MVLFDAQGRELSAEQWEPPGENCPLRDANSRRVPKLTVKV